ncbi:uncharacterized protein LOC126838857 isoform X2 [Adelges cooleyi]|uniref:uncharacterized protein LOC126838857 isoform X2 n=1 Tax=Adelges cooleyi TaxID=133065 RepID=UPI00217F2497|nr:uncharacterized protein LOC126838857 isoform X2 [Adelges cooleyi]
MNLFIMTKHLNIDIDSITLDHKFSTENLFINFRNKLTCLENEVSDVYTQKVEKHYRETRLLSEAKMQLNCNQDKLRYLTEKLDQDRHTLQTENERLDATNNECKMLEVEKENLSDMVAKSKEELDQVSRDKKELLKKLKKEIKSFQAGVNMYERFMQIVMKIKYEDLSVLVEVTMENSNNHKNYSVVFKEDKNDFRRITPSNQLIVKAGALYNQNKDVQGLLAFIYHMDE